MCSISALTSAVELAGGRGEDQLIPELPGLGAASDARLHVVAFHPVGEPAQATVAVERVRAERDVRDVAQVVEGAVRDLRHVVALEAEDAQRLETGQRRALDTLQLVVADQSVGDGEGEKHAQKLRGRGAGRNLAATKKNEQRYDSSDVFVYVGDKAQEKGKSEIHKL